MTGTDFKGKVEKGQYISSNSFKGLVKLKSTAFIRNFISFFCLVYRDRRCLHRSTSSMMM